MAFVSVIYRAPKGDNKVAEWGEYTFFDGIAVEIEDNEDNRHMLGKMKNNPGFELSEMHTGETSFPEMKTAVPPYPRVVEAEDLGNDKPAEFEDYVPQKRGPGRPKKVVAEIENDGDEDAA